jgi:Ca-activated chloride channel family protein
MLNYCIPNQRRQEIAVLAAMTLAAVAGLLPTAPAYAQVAEPVSLYVTVTQGDKLIGGLRQENFRLYEDGQSREFRLAEPEQPISIALLVEYSQSSSLYFDDIQAAVQWFVKEAPEGNWYALATFSKDMEIQVDFTKLVGRITEAFFEPGGPLWNEVNTFDAVDEMLDTLGRLPGRRVLIVVGSGLDTFSERTLDRIQKRIQSTSSNVTVYAVGAGSLLRGTYEPYLSASARMSLLQAQSFMRTLADESGGEAWFPNFQAAYPDVMRSIMQDIAFQYRLVYVPQIPRDGKFHKIKVEAFQIVNDKRQNFKVSARKGWRF